MFDWVEIPSGPFTMGAAETDGQAWPEELPAHTLTLPRFKIGRTPVTNAQFRPFLESGGYTQEKYWTPKGWAWRHGAEIDLSPIEHPGVRSYYEESIASRSAEKRSQPRSWETVDQSRSNYPVVGVSWYEALAYCSWQNEQNSADGVIALPTESQWEKAARGPDANIYPWGNQWDETRLNFADEEPGSVGQFPQGASVYGVLDLAGCVWNWTLSSWGNTSLFETDFPYPYRQDGRENLSLPGLRIVRGAAWTAKPVHFRTTHRGRHIPGDAGHNIGFRVVLNEPDSART